MAQSVKRPASAQVMISRFVSSSHTSGSVLAARGLGPALDSVSPSLSAPPALSLYLSLSLSLSLSQKLINIKKKEELSLQKSLGSCRGLLPSASSGCTRFTGWCFGFSDKPCTLTSDESSQVRVVRQRSVKFGLNFSMCVREGKKHQSPGTPPLC